MKDVTPMIREHKFVIDAVFASLNACLEAATGKDYRH